MKPKSSTEIPPLSSASSSMAASPVSSSMKAASVDEKRYDEATKRDSPSKKSAEEQATPESFSNKTEGEFVLEDDIGVRLLLLAFVLVRHYIKYKN